MLCARFFCFSAINTLLNEALNKCMKKNIAVVGCGYWGKNLVRNFYELGVLRAVCDPNTKVAEQYAAKYNVDAKSFSEINEDQDIDAVVLAVPASLHASMANEVMSHKKHVYVEKPLALTQVDAEGMIASAKENGVQLMVGHLLQYHPAFVAVKQFIASGEIGTLQYIYSNRLSFGKIRTEEDVLWSFAPHDISMILSLAKEEPEEVRTESANALQIDKADIATIHMRYKSGLRAQVAVSWLHPFKEHKLVVVGSTGMVVFDDTKSWAEKLAVINHQVDFSQGMPIAKKSDLRFIDLEPTEPLRNECQHFIDVASGDTAPLTSGIEGLSVLRVLHAAELSMLSNRTINIREST